MTNKLVKKFRKDKRNFALLPHTIIIFFKELYKNLSLKKINNNKKITNTSKVINVTNRISLAVF